MAALENGVFRLDFKPPGQVLCLMFCVAPIMSLELVRHPWSCDCQNAKGAEEAA
jgi:hypothetical protein